MTSSKILITSLLCIFLFSTATEAAITCSDVAKYLNPCVSYLRNGSGKPPAACCNGVSSLAAAATTSADKKSACACIKTSAKSINPKPELAKNLATNCNVNLGVSVSPNVDCSMVG